MKIYEYFFIFEMKFCNCKIDCYEAIFFQNVILKKENRFLNFQCIF